MTKFEQRQIVSTCKENIKFGLAKQEDLNKKSLNKLKSKGVDIKQTPQVILEELFTAWQSVLEEEKKYSPFFDKTWKSFQNATNVDNLVSVEERLAQSSAETILVYNKSNYNVATTEKNKNEQKNEQIENNEFIPAASGTGFNVSKSGHIVTNYHVINGCESVKVHIEGNTYEASVINIDSVNDLAILKTKYSPSTIFSY